MTGDAQCYRCSGQRHLPSPPLQRWPLLPCLCRHPGRNRRQGYWAGRKCQRWARSQPSPRRLLLLIFPSASAAALEACALPLLGWLERRCHPLRPATPWSLGALQRCDPCRRVAPCTLPIVPSDWPVHGGGNGRAVASSFVGIPVTTVTTRAAVHSAVRLCGCTGGWVGGWVYGVKICGCAGVLCTAAAW